MNQAFKKTALLMGACSLLGVYSPVMAANPEVSVEAVQQTTKKVTGTVSDSQGPVIGASVVEKGTTNGVVTDFDGNFTLNVKPGATLVISYIGYTTQEVATGNQANFNITLKEDNALLDEVVVVGYGVQKKKLVTGATVQVKGEDIAKLNTTNALTAMQASSPGVNIAQSSSQPGKGFKVNIRGVGTIGVSSPLLIIDGINAGTADDGLNGLNPNDIESIDVLKDAASAAIYGARAANGVILVTTKQGKAGKLSIQYDGYVGWSNAYKVPGLVNAKQYMQLISEANFNTYGTATDWSSIVPQSILDKVENGWQGTDWFKEYENKNALQFSHAVTLSGGSDRSKFSMSLNYSSNEGIMGGDNASSYKRYGGRINSEHIVLKGKDLLGEEHDLLTIGENVSYWYHKSHDLAEGNGYWNIMQAAYVASPLVEPYNADGSLTSWDKNGAGQYSSTIYSNPLNHFMNGGYNSLNKSRDFGFGATIYWIVEPIKNLRYRGQFNTGYSSSNHRHVSLPYSSSYTSASNNYQMTMNASENSSFNMENTLSYILPDLGKHHIDVLVGQSFERSNWSMGMENSFTVGAENLNSLVLNGWDFNIPSNYESQYIVGHSGYDNPRQGNIASFFGRINWNYDEKYMLTAILRTDGSSNFAKGKRWGTFPSVSAGWVITNEPFMAKSSKWLDFLKIRASWGQNGNCNIGNFYYLSNIGFSPTEYPDYGYKFSSDMINTVSQNVYHTGAYAKNVPNEDVTWETSEQWDLGLDARFLNGRLGLNFDWYVKKTKDWLVQAPMNEVLGYEEPAMINGGDIKNTGFEIGLSWRDKIGKDFNYHASLNFATNKNKVTRLAVEGGKIGTDGAYASTLFQNSSYVSVVEEGHPIGYFSGMSHNGIWQNQDQIDAARAAGKAVLANAQPGDPIWVDYDGDGTINYDKDRHEIGQPHPKVTLGLNLGFDWKGLDFGITGYGAFGQQIMQCYRTAQLATAFNNWTVDAFDRWTGEGTNNNRPRLMIGGEANTWVSDLYMQNADYFRIQNITLGYDFTKLWKTSPFQQLRFYVQVQNLYTFTGYTGVDPECTSDGGKYKNGSNQYFIRGIDVGLYPSARTWVIGASIKF
jgi:TonB-linked SusC/RagA family outer membrane protein